MAKRTYNEKEIGILFKELKKKNKSSLKNFPVKHKTLDVPKEHGVYVIRDKNGAVLHVGRTLRGEGGLHQRLRSHLCGHSSFMGNYEKIDPDKLRKKCRFRYVTVRCPRKRALLEAYTTGHLCPKYIGTGEESA
ncbi:MAG: GIY-YIG nuclease family protein [Rhodospirillales bacterium]